MCPKQCKHFGVKNARGEPEILWAKRGSGPKIHFVDKELIFVTVARLAKKNAS